MTQRKRKTVSKEGIQTSEVQEKGAKNVSTSEAEADTLTLNEYLSKVHVHPGLVASFNVEVRRKPSLSEPKTMDEWKAVFAKQGKRIYR